MSSEVAQVVGTDYPFASFLELDDICLLDSHPDEWQRLIDMRGGCRCCFSPPCNACVEPITVDEAVHLGLIPDPDDPQPEPKLQSVEGPVVYGIDFAAELSETVVYIDTQRAAAWADFKAALEEADQQRLAELGIRFVLSPWQAKAYEGAFGPLPSAFMVAGALPLHMPVGPTRLAIPKRLQHGPARKGKGGKLKRW